MGALCKLLTLYDSFSEGRFDQIHTNWGSCYPIEHYIKRLFQGGHVTYGTDDQFKQRVIHELLPLYISLPKCNMKPEGFKHDWCKIVEGDASDFLRALDASLIEHTQHGKYRAARSHSVVKFFWEGKRALNPRLYGLWAEPIITVGALGRMHFELGWPAHLLGAESKNGSFDLIACLKADDTNEYVACEVKKNRTELDKCIRLMKEFASDPDKPEPGSRDPRNAWKKIRGLRDRRAPLFWALGPDRYEFVYHVRYDGEVIAFDEGSLADLRFPGP